jgi:hypothetical protein
MVKKQVKKATSVAKLSLEDTLVKTIKTIGFPSKYKEGEKCLCFGSEKNPNCQYLASQNMKGVFFSEPVYKSLTKSGIQVSNASDLINLNILQQKDTFTKLKIFEKKEQFGERKSKPFVICTSTK